MASGQLFSRTTQALFFNYKQNPVQRMLDFDFLCGQLEGIELFVGIRCVEHSPFSVHAAQDEQLHPLLASSHLDLTVFRSFSSGKRRLLCQFTQGSIQMPHGSVSCFTVTHLNRRICGQLSSLRLSVVAGCKAHPTADVFINFASFRR